MSEAKPVTGSRFSRWLDAHFHAEADGSIRATLALQPEQEGAPGYVHGGVSASLIDEAMGAAVWATGRRAMTVHMSFDYRRPVPLGVEVTVIGRVERFEGRKTFTSGAIILPDGAAAVEGAGIFVDAPPEIVGGNFGFDHIKTE